MSWRVELQKEINKCRTELEDKNLSISNWKYDRNDHWYTGLLEQRAEYARKLSKLEKELAEAKARGEIGRSPSEIMEEISRVQLKANEYSYRENTAANVMEQIVSNALIQGSYCEVNALQQELREAIQEERERPMKYERLVQEMNRASTENDYKELVNKFHAMGDYRDTTVLADKCDTQYRILKERREERERQEKYGRMVQENDKASTEKEYLKLTQELRSMNGYKNTTELANKCDTQYRILKYERLVREVEKASTEEWYHKLTQELRSMNGYKDTTELADKCDTQYRILKERREAEERERELQRIEEDKKKAKARKKRNAILIMACLVIVAVGISFLVIRQKNIEKELKREFTTVSSQLLYVREGPSTDYEPPIDEILQNTKVEVLERYDDSSWVRISYGDGKIGYVDGEHLWRAVGLYVGKMYQGNMDLLGSLNWIRRNVITNGNYTIVLGKDETVTPISLSFNNMPVNITLETAGTDGRSVRYSVQPSSSLITIGSGVTFVLEEGVNLIGRQNNTKRLVSVDGGTFIMNGGSIRGNRASSNGGGVVVESGTFIMNNGSIIGNASANGGGVYLRNGNFILNNGTISGNTGYESGGGVIINNKSIFTMNDGSITGNNASGTEQGHGGGGVCVENGTFIIHNGTISGNSTARSGGGVILIEGTFTMNNGTINGNKADNRNGGGIHIVDGTFTMNNGAISGNSCMNYGGGVNVPGGVFTMNNGIISGNRAQYGGGVSVSNGTFSKSNRAGIIYGSNASDSLANRASSNNNGHAVVLADSNGNVSRVRNSTAGATQAMDSSQRGAAGGWQ